MEYHIQKTDMSRMFMSCSKLTTLDISKWNTSEVTSMLSMFDNCPSLTNLDVSKWDTNKVTNMSEMFMNCSKLTNLDLSKWNTNEVTNMKWMFANCQLTEVKVSQETYKNMTTLAEKNNTTLEDYQTLYTNIIKIVDKK